MLVYQIFLDYSGLRLNGIHLFLWYSFTITNPAIAINSRETNPKINILLAKTAKEDRMKVGIITQAPIILVWENISKIPPTN